MVVWTEGRPGLLALAHVGSYALIVAFLVANRRMPGLWLVALGTAMNVSAIVANGGVMPASRSALESAGRLPAVPPDRFLNSTVVRSPELAFLGDVFAWPEPLPLAGVFSAGDVCIVVGAFVVVHQVCGSRLAASSRRHSQRSVKPLGHTTRF